MRVQLFPSALRHTPRLRLALLLAAPAVLLSGAAIVCPDTACGAGAVDAAGLALAARGHAPLVDAFFRFITWGGSLLVLGPLAIAHAIFAWQRLRSWQAFFVPCALAGAVLMGHAAKMLVARERPALDALIEMPADASFPSAHTLQVSTFVLAWLLAPGLGAGRPRALAIGLAILLVVLVAWSRLHLQVHYPSDILFALAAGTIWVVALRQLAIWSPQA
jgi:undecaprenyl-diphosphatase